MVKLLAAALFALAATALATPTKSELPCENPDGCEVRLGRGTWKVYTPRGQMVGLYEIDNETGYVLETSPPPE